MPSPGSLITGVLPPPPAPQPHLRTHPPSQLLSRDWTNLLRQALSHTLDNFIKVPGVSPSPVCVHTHTPAVRRASRDVLISILSSLIRPGNRRSVIMNLN